jgi:hypothetical protein
MDDAAAVDLAKNQEKDQDLASVNRLKERLDRLLRDAAQVEVELSRAERAIQGIPHYSVIEGRAHELGKRLSRYTQQQQMNELVASTQTTALCPKCRNRCELIPRGREVKSVDGDIALQEMVGHCPCCRRDFFPNA